MRMFLGLAGLAAAAAGLLLIAPAPSLAGDYGHGYRDAYDSGWSDNRRDDGNASYDAYNSYDGYARYRHGRRGYWERPYDRRYRYCRSTRYGGCYRGYHGGGYYDGYGSRTWYYPGYGYGDTPSPAFPAGGYDGYGRGGRDPARIEWCSWNYRSYNPRTGYYVGYDGYRHWCG